MTVRVFVGTDPNNRDLEQQSVFEYSLRKYASEPVQIEWMMLRRSGFWSGWNTASWTTPFTGLRVGIPARCDYKGRAIYADADVIWRADVAELWNQPIPGAMLLKSAEGKLQTSVMLMDCAEMQLHLPTIAQIRRSPEPNADMRAYFSERRQYLAPFAGDWNCIDLKGYADINDPAIKLIHYSRISSQPSMPHAVVRLAKTGQRHWYDGVIDPHARPELVELFESQLIAADAAGFGVDRYRVQPFGPHRKKSLKNYGAKKRCALT